MRKSIPEASADWECLEPAGPNRVDARSMCMPSKTSSSNPAPLGRARLLSGCRLSAPRPPTGAPALKQFVREETLPGAQIQTDDELLDYSRRNGGTCYHASCTCMMGSYPMSVVDSELRVARYRWAARHRRLGDAGGHLDQHQR